MTSQEYLSRIQSTKDLGVTFGYTKRPWHKSLLALSRETSKNAKKKTADAPVATNVNVTISPDFLYRDAKTGRTETLLVSKTDGNILQELDRDTLQPKRYFTYTDINPALKGILSAAHEESDPVTGSFINFTLEPGRKNTYTFFEISKEHPEGEILAVLKSKHIAYSHSFLSTKNYVIFMEYPLRLKYSGLSLLFHQSFSKGLYFAKEEPTLFHVMDRQAKSHVATFTYDSFFCFHTINAFDSPDGGITLDLCGFPNADAVLKAGTRADMMSVFDKTADKQTVDSNIRPLYQRYHLDMSLASLNTPLPKATLTPNANGKAVQIDLMCIHPGYRHKEYTFVYGMSWQFSHLRRHDLFDCIIKLNRETMEVLPYHRVGWTPSEPVFVPNPQGTSEEDGCLMVVMLNGTSKQSALVILDAKTMQEIAVIELPEGLVVPFGFHGAFEPKSQVKA